MIFLRIDDFERPLSHGEGACAFFREVKLTLSLAKKNLLVSLFELYKDRKYKFFYKSLDALLKNRTQEAVNIVNLILNELRKFLVH